MGIGIRGINANKNRKNQSKAQDKKIAKKLYFLFKSDNIGLITLMENILGREFYYINWPRNIFLRTDKYI